MCNYATDRSGRVLDVARCDSSGEKAFPNTDVCSCSMGGDKASDLRFWGTATGRKMYNPETGKLEKADKVQFYNNWDMTQKMSKMSLSEYEDFMRSGELPCHSKLLFTCSKLNKSASVTFDI